MAVIITTNHLRFIKEMEYTQNTPKIKVQALILQDLQAPGVHCLLKPPALTFKQYGLSIKMPLTYTLTSGQQEPGSLINWLELTYTVPCLLHMPLIVVTFTSRLVLSASLVAH